jgi:hypothetical protein
VSVTVPPELDEAPLLEEVELAEVELLLEEVEPPPLLEEVELLEEAELLLEEAELLLEESAPPTPDVPDVVPAVSSATITCDAQAAMVAAESKLQMVSAGGRMGPGMHRPGHRVNARTVAGACTAATADRAATAQGTDALCVFHPASFRRRSAPFRVHLASLRQGYRPRSKASASRRTPCTRRRTCRSSRRHTI